MEILYANNDLNDDSNNDKNTKYLLIKSKKIRLIFSGEGILYIHQPYKADCYDIGFDNNTDFFIKNYKYGDIAALNNMACWYTNFQNIIIHNKRNYGFCSLLCFSNNQDLNDSFIFGIYEEYTNIINEINDQEWETRKQYCKINSSGVSYMYISNNHSKYENNIIDMKECLCDISDENLKKYINDIIEKYYFKAIDICIEKSCNSYQVLLPVLINFATYYKKQHEYSIAETYYLIALDLCKSSNKEFKKEECLILEELADLYNNKMSQTKYLIKLLNTLDIHTHCSVILVQENVYHGCTTCDIYAYTTTNICINIEKNLINMYSNKQSEQLDELFNQYFEFLFNNKILEIYHTNEKNYILMPFIDKFKEYPNEYFSLFEKLDTYCKTNYISKTYYYGNVLVAINKVILDTCNNLMSFENNDMLNQNKLFLHNIINYEKDNFNNDFLSTLYYANDKNNKQFEYNDNFTFLNSLYDKYKLSPSDYDISDKKNNNILRERADNKYLGSIHIYNAIILDIFKNTSTIPKYLSVAGFNTYLFLKYYIVKNFKKLPRVIIMYISSFLFEEFTIKENVNVITNKKTTKKRIIKPKVEKCKDGCIRVEKILQRDDKYHRSEVAKHQHKRLTKYKCYNEISEENDEPYGHINYAVMSYAADNGHLHCIKYLHQRTNVDWHNDLAIVAAKVNQLECLKYIATVMGEVFYNLKNLDCPEECKKYIESSNLFTL